MKPRFFLRTFIWMFVALPLLTACAQNGAGSTLGKHPPVQKTETTPHVKEKTKSTPVSPLKEKFPDDKEFEVQGGPLPSGSIEKGTAEPGSGDPEFPEASGQAVSETGEPQRDFSSTQEAGATLPIFEDEAKQQKGFVAVNVFYGTTRQYTGSRVPPKFYGGEAGGDLEYGVSTISVPTDPKLRAKGSLTTPLTLFEIQMEKEDPQKHVILTSAIRLDREKFLERLNENLESHPAMLVFVHGFNNTFEYALQRAAQLSYDLEFDGTPVVFSWPSNGQAQDYIKDANRIRAAAIDLRMFLKELHHGARAKSVYLVAHSMGSVALTNALHDLALEMKEAHKPIFNEVILAAPDIDRVEFKKLFAEFKRITARTTLYASSRDQALIISREVNGYIRAGDSTGGILTLPGLDSIDVSRLDTDLIGHSYFGDNKSVISDIYRLIRGSPIYQRGQLVKRTLQGLTFWEFIP